MSEPMFAAQWNDDSDVSFRPFAVAVFELRNAKRLPESARRVIFRDLCLRKRVAFLSDIAGKTIQTRILKLLSRTNWKDFSRGDWKTFLSIASEDGNSELGYVPRITRTLLRQFALIPEEIRLPSLLNIVSNLEVTTERWNQWREFIHPSDAGQLAEFRRTAGTMKSKGEFWDLYFRSEGRDLMPFSFPSSLSESKLLEPINSAQAMTSEAIRMKNCLANRISRVHGGNRIFFRLRNRFPANAELIRKGQAWVPGNILGYENSPVANEMAQQIAVELQRLANSISTTNDSIDSDAENSYIAKLQQFARESFAPEDIAQLVAPLQSIHSKSISWKDAAYAIFEPKGGGYVQFMSSPEDNEYLVEISSHKYVEKVNDFLSADVVDMIEKAGFVWPTQQNNFLRWFNASTPEEIQALAEVALAILARMFRYRKGGKVIVKTHIPTGSVTASYA